MRRFTLKTGVFEREVKAFGDIIDPVEVSREKYVEGTHVIVTGDRKTGMITAYPAEGKNSEAIVNAIKK